MCSEPPRSTSSCGPPDLTGIAFTTGDGETTLTEHNAIACLLAEAAGDAAATAQLVGSTPAERLTVLQWLFWNQARFEPAVGKLEALVRGGQTRGPEQKAAAQELVGLVEHLELSLRECDWTGRSTLLKAADDGGAGPSLADIAVASTLQAAFAVAFDEDTREDYGNCLRLYEKVCATPGLEGLFEEEGKEEEEEEEEEDR